MEGGGGGGGGGEKESSKSRSSQGMTRRKEKMHNKTFFEIKSITDKYLISFLSVTLTMCNHARKMMKKDF